MDGRDCHGSQEEMAARRTAALKVDKLLGHKRDDCRVLREQKSDCCGDFSKAFLMWILERGKNVQRG